MGVVKKGNKNIGLPEILFSAKRDEIMLNLRQIKLLYKINSKFIIKVDFYNYFGLACNSLYFFRRCLGLIDPTHPSHQIFFKAQCYQ